GDSAHCGVERGSKRPFQGRRRREGSGSMTSSKPEPEPTLSPRAARVRNFVEPLAFALLALGAAFGAFGVIYGESLRYVGFETPLWFAAAALPLLALAVRIGFAPRPATMRFSRGASLRGLGRGVWAYLAELPAGLRLAAALCLVIALARPTSSRMSDEISREGIDIAIALDMSESMK